MGKKTAVEVYLSTVFKWGLIILVSACMCATVMFNTEKLFGLYPDVPWLAFILFALMDITFFAIAVTIVKTSFDKEGLAMSKTPHVQYLCGFSRHGNLIYHSKFIVTISSVWYN